MDEPMVLGLRNLENLPSAPLYNSVTRLLCLKVLGSGCRFRGIHGAVLWCRGAERIQPAGPAILIKKSKPCSHCDMSSSVRPPTSDP